MRRFLLFACLASSLLTSPACLAATQEEAEGGAHFLDDVSMLLSYSEVLCKDDVTEEDRAVMELIGRILERPDDIDFILRKYIELRGKYMDEAVMSAAFQSGKDLTEHEVCRSLRSNLADLLKQIEGMARKNEEQKE